MRGNGQKAQAAKASGKLSAFVKPADAKGESTSDREFVDWMEVDHRLVSGAVWAVNKEGGAILFGQSKDKSCYSIKIYSGTDAGGYYFPCSESGLAELSDFLQRLCDLGTGDV